MATNPQTALEELDNLEYLEDGGVIVDLNEPEEITEDTFGAVEDDFYGNLVTQIDPDVLDRLGYMVDENVESDEESRSEWMRTIEFALDLIGIKVEERNTPFDGACSAQHPLIMESAVKFQSKASSELLPAKGPVKTVVLGDVTTEKEDQANRVKSHMNYQILEEMTEFYTDTERALLYVSLIGSGFKKTYYSDDLERPVSEFITADDLIVPNNAPDLHRSPRYTHRIHKTYHQLEKDFASGFYHDPEEDIIVPSQPVQNPIREKMDRLMGMEISNVDKEDISTLYEQYLDTCIEGLDEYEGKKKYKLASPYIITIEAGSKKVIGVRRNWKQGDKKRRRKVNITHYQFVPGFGFYSLGFLHLLGNLQLALTSSMRSLVDAGQFANLQGGFKLKGVRISDDSSPISPGQWKEIETPLQDISKAFYALPYKEGSSTLLNMLQYMTTAGQKFADSTEQVLSDATNYGPVGTTMALLDASTKFFGAIHKRLHNSLKQELKIIAEINAETLPDDLEYNLENVTMRVSRSDYDNRVDIVPVSDPNSASNAHRLAKAQTMLEMAMRAPEVHDMREVMKHVYINMDYANVDKILPPPQEAQPQDPMTDIQLATQGKAIKAFQGQDHKAHIAIKQAFMQDPMSGANPMMQKASIAIQANIQEHMYMNFLEQVQAQGVLTQEPEDIAASQVAQMNQQKLIKDQEQAQQSPRDQAALLLAQAEMLDTQTQAKKADFDQKLSAAELELKKEQLDLQKFVEVRRSQEFDAKLKADMDKVVQTKGLDAMIDGLSKQIDHKNQVELAKINDKGKYQGKTSE